MRLAPKCTISMCGTARTVLSNNFDSVSCQHKTSNYHHHPSDKSTSANRNSTVESTTSNINDIMNANSLDNSIMSDAAIIKFENFLLEDDPTSGSLNDGNEGLVNIKFPSLDGIASSSNFIDPRE